MMRKKGHQKKFRLCIQKNDGGLKNFKGGSKLLWA